MDNTLRDRLLNCLTAASERTNFSGGGVAVYGAGNSSSLCEGSFKAEGIEPAYYIDNAPVRRGTVFLGRPVIGYDEAKEKCRGFLILVCTGAYSTCESIFNSFREDPIEGALCLTYDEYVFLRHADEIMRVFNWLEDELSRETYVNMLLARMHREKQRYELTAPGHYFAIPEFTFCSSGEVFVDCGACVGDSIEQYLNMKSGIFGEIYAFEPDKRNFAAMEIRMARLEREWAIVPERVTLVNAGVGEKSTRLAMNNTDRDAAALGARFSLDQAGGQGDSLPIVTLDEYFSGRSISFLKADIESFEYAMLLGAERVIKRDMPKAAICIYHNPSDMFRIAVKLKELVPEYHLAVRQHGNEQSETVLYAWR